MKTTIKTLSNSNLCPDTVERLAKVVKDTEGSISFHRTGTDTMDGPCHVVKLATDLIQIAIPLDSAFVEFRLRAREFDHPLFNRKLDHLLLRQGGYQRGKGYCVVVCLNAVVLELLHGTATILRDKL